MEWDDWCPDCRRIHKGPDCAPKTRSLSLRDYVQHKRDCQLNLKLSVGEEFAKRYTLELKCTCGLDDALRAQEPPQAQSLHDAIMNLPVKDTPGLSVPAKLAYKLGHRDARHQAAELVVGDTPVSAERST